MEKTNCLLIFGIISIFLVSACAQQQAQETATQPSVIEAAVGAEDDAPSQETVQAETPAPGKEDAEETAVVPAEGQSRVVEIDMTARQWDFTPSTITVNEGDIVKLKIRNVDVTHGFAIFEFGVNERLTPGKTTTTEFVADKKGEYTFFCSVPCGRGHRDMKGTLIVK